MEEHRCSECGKAFSSDEMLEKHLDLEHGGKGHSTEKTSFDFSLPLDKKQLTGFMIGFMLTAALIGGYTYLDNREPTVGITVVTCDNCSYSEFRETTDEILKTDYREVNYKSEEGWELVEKYDLYYVPGFIFDKNVEKAENFTRIESIAVKFKDAYVLPDKGVEAAQRVSKGKSLDR